MVCCYGVGLKPSISRSNIGLFCILVAFLAATGFLATQHKSDFIQWYEGWSTSITYDEIWPSSEFWWKLSEEPRSSNSCVVFNCSMHGVQSQSSPFSYPFSREDTCPFYFRYIHEDLAPWAETGITNEMFKNAKDVATFRVVIKMGRLYVNPYTSCFQTRALFTIWGLLQLLEYYPGLVPDVDLLFRCGDTPVVSRDKYANGMPPPVFGYCSTANHFDIPFPDWSFWGWPEVDLKTWDQELYGILRGQNDLLWEQRRPVAFWRGNTDTGGALRKWLQNCHGPAEIIHQDWGAAVRANFKNSRIAQQCRHRYKIYVEGWGWSVSLKYILACDSPVLLVNPVFFDFFSRGLMPMQHFWPIKSDSLCESIRRAVDWGNNNIAQAERMGRVGSQFIAKEVSMKFVYDYMLHALHEYAKLMRFEANLEGFDEVCFEGFLCQAPPKEKALYEASKVKVSSDTPPCFLPPRDEKLIQETWQRRVNITTLVQKVEDSPWSGSKPAYEIVLNALSIKL